MHLLNVTWEIRLLRCESWETMSDWKDSWFSSINYCNLYHTEFLCYFPRTYVEFGRPNYLICNVLLYDCACYLFFLTCRSGGVSKSNLEIQFSTSNLPFDRIFYFYLEKHQLRRNLIGFLFLPSGRHDLVEIKIYSQRLITCKPCAYYSFNMKWSLKALFQQS